MEPLAEQLIGQHIVELQREAAANRLVKAASAAARREATQRPPRVALRLASSGLMFVATRLDPNLRRPSYGRE
jgi:hypothetical protein